MANRKFPASLYRLCVVYVAENVHSLCPANEETFARAFPLGVSKDLVVQSLKQQNFTSLYHLIKHLLSRNGLRYIEHRFPVAILSRLPGLVRETPDYLKHLVELSLDGVVNQDNRRMVEMLCQQAGLRLVTQRPRNVPDRPQVQVSENCNHLCKSPFSFPPVANDRLYHLMTRQHLLESEMCLVRRITVRSPFDLRHGLLLEQRVTVSFLAKLLLPLPEDCQLNFAFYNPCSVRRMLQSSTALLPICSASNFHRPNRLSLVFTGQESILHAGLLREFKNHALGVSSATLKIFSLEQAEPGLGVVGIGLNTLALCMFHLYAASVGEECPVLKNLGPKDMLTLIPSNELSVPQDTHFMWLLRLKFPVKKIQNTSPEQLLWLLRNGYKPTGVSLEICQLTETCPEVAFGTFPKLHEL
ncbi:hypothetical protein HPB51_007662 [Rhipicephalus microplus]|uniref:Uncharacterized protein n=1 Tax=Rhipicephalus microplus TaxID=6941 RepID=A0A9J6D950_RHIMP|nr:hypothetical protein HPB51_007662 [Rhipicephalus microplus]